MNMHADEGINATKSHWNWDVDKHGKPVIVVDFDHTITKTCLSCSDAGGFTLQEDVIEVLAELNKGYYIIIYTGRQINEIKGIRAFLRLNKVPHDAFLINKPNACFWIDDRAIHHTSWAESLKTVKDRDGGYLKEILEMKKEVLWARMRTSCEYHSMEKAPHHEDDHHCSNPGNPKSVLRANCLAMWCPLVRR